MKITSRMKPNEATLVAIQTPFILSLLQYGVDGVTFSPVFVKPTRAPLPPLRGVANERTRQESRPALSSETATLRCAGHSQTPLSTSMVAANTNTSTTNKKMIIGTPCR